MSNKRLYKSTVNCMLCGVCGGIAEYFDIDPTLVRLAWVILTCFGGLHHRSHYYSKSIKMYNFLYFVHTPHIHAKLTKRSNDI